MLTEKRHSLILSMLEEKGALSVTELVEQLNTSESTIRRDLVTLDRGGWLKKVHGGAVKPDSGVIMTEPNMTVISLRSTIISQYGISRKPQITTIRSSIISATAISSST